MGKAESLRDFCPALWDEGGVSGDMGVSLCAFGGSSSAGSGRPGSASDVRYGCYVEECPQRLQGLPLVMSERVDSEGCENAGFFLKVLFEGGECTSRAPQAGGSPVGGAPYSPRSGPGSTESSWGLWVGAVAVVAVFVLFVLLAWVR